MLRWCLNWVGPASPEPGRKVSEQQAACPRRIIPARETYVPATLPGTSFTENASVQREPVTCSAQSVTLERHSEWHRKKAQLSAVASISLVQPIAGVCVRARVSAACTPCSGARGVASCSSRIAH